jgi:hypothetical protein
VQLFGKRLFRQSPLNSIINHLLPYSKTKLLLVNPFQFSQWTGFLIHYAIMDNMSTIQTIELIATNPEVRNGRPYILGTTVTVSDVAIAKNYHTWMLMALQTGTV